MSEARGRMSKGERDDLARVVRLREKVLKTAAAERSAWLLSDFEAQLAAEYAFDDDAVWARAKEAAQKVVDAAQAEVEARCRALGIPDQFAPGLSLGWYSRGENAVRERRAELRLAARARVAAEEKRARAEVERWSADTQTKLLAAGLDSAEARTFLESMPTAEALMPPLTLGDVEARRLGIVRERREAQAERILETQRLLQDVGAAPPATDGEDADAAGE